MHVLGTDIFQNIQCIVYLSSVKLPRIVNIFYFLSDYMVKTTEFHNQSQFEYHLHYSHNRFIVFDLKVMFILRLSTCVVVFMH